MRNFLRKQHVYLEPTNPGKKINFVTVTVEMSEPELNALYKRPLAGAICTIA